MSLALRGTDGGSSGLLLRALNIVNLALAVGMAQTSDTGLQYTQGMAVSSSQEQLTRLADTILRSFLCSMLGDAVTGELLPRLMDSQDTSHRRTTPLGGAGTAGSEDDGPALAVAAASFLLFWLLQLTQQAFRNMPADASGSPSLEAVIHWAAGVLSNPLLTDTLNEALCSPLPCVAAQVLLAALLRFSPGTRTKATGLVTEMEPRVPPSTMTCLLLGLQSAACSEDFRVRNTALLAICLVTSWGSDESSALVCSPWTQYLFQSGRLLRAPAELGGEKLGASPFTAGHQWKGTIKRCMASLVASTSRLGMGFLVPDLASQLENLDSDCRAPGAPGIQLNPGIASPDIQVFTAAYQCLEHASFEHSCPHTDVCILLIVSLCRLP